MSQYKHIEAVIAGEAIKECREKRGLTQLELSNATGVSTEQICNIEKGRSNPHIVTFLKLLDGMDFGFDIIDLTVEMTGDM